LRGASSHLTGSDIAEHMIWQVNEQQRDGTLQQVELLTFLQEDTQHYDLIVAADVLPYLADLDPLFKSVRKHLNAHGHFIFTTEISIVNPWKLETTARFSHHPEYIKELITQCDFQLIRQEKIPARLQNQVLLEVFLFVIQPFAKG